MPIKLINQSILLQLFYIIQNNAYINYLYLLLDIWSFILLILVSILLVVKTVVTTAYITTSTTTISTITPTIDNLKTFINWIMICLIMKIETDVFLFVQEVYLILI